MGVRKILRIRKRRRKRPETVGELMLTLETNLAGMKDRRGRGKPTHLEPYVVKLYRKELTALLGDRVEVACDGINVYVGGAFVKDVYETLTGIKTLKINERLYTVVDHATIKNQEGQDLLHLLDDLWDDCVDEAYRLERQSNALKLLIDKGYTRTNTFENFERYSNGEHRFLYNIDTHRIIWLKDRLK